MGAAAEKITRYTYSDYLCWDDKERWEIIDGEAYSMSPAPLIKHQNIAGNLYVKLKTHRKNPCYTGIAPTDVVFDEENVKYRSPEIFNWDETFRLITVKIDIHLREIFEKEQ